MSHLDYTELQFCTSTIKRVYSVCGRREHAAAFGLRPTIAWESAERSVIDVVAAGLLWNEANLFTRKRNKRHCPLSLDDFDPVLR
jgi:hypothetical protein